MQDLVGDAGARTPDRSGPATGSGGSGATLMFATAIFASAFLIFLVQPMVGKRILPWFGGVPSVWTLCLAFYQTTLFVGYAYAHGMIRLVKPRIQPWLHAAFVVAAALSLPVLPESAPAVAAIEEDPTRAVLSLLTSHVALPFLVLASTGPLVQAWFARAHPTASPYPLYAVSNVGSLLALFVFPFVLEPMLPLTSTGRAFSVGFVVTMLLVLACAARSASGADTASDASAAKSEAEKLGADRVALWLLLSGAAVVLLMGVTNKLCLDVASFPFLWIVPLATYLVTFILCFASERFYSRALLVPIAIAAFAWTRYAGSEARIHQQVLAYCTLLFSACMILHGELYRMRPAPRSLTAFYLCVSAGGAIAGILVGIVAPRVFDDYYELQIGMVLGFLLVILVALRDPESWLRAVSPGLRIFVLAPLALVAIGYFAFLELQPAPEQLYKERSFFGVLTVHANEGREGPRRWLTNGTTIHGAQHLGPGERRLPTAYFGRATGLGLTLTSRPKTGESRIAVIGLGVGTLAAYGRPGDTMRFYEIDPVVERLASRGGYFSFLEDSKATVDVVLGDARLSIAGEQERGERQDFDILVLDAFSSDAIPVHLMTREAFERYFDALAEGGLMAVHVSNRHFHLKGLVARIAEELGAYSLMIRSRPAPELLSGLTDWVIVARDSDQLTRLSIRIQNRHRALGLPRGNLVLQRGSEANLDAFPIWTDDYSDLLSVLRWE